MGELFKFFLFLPLNMFQMFVCYLPGQAGVLLRRYYYGRRFRKCGKDLWIGTNVQISDPSRIEVGDDVKIRENVILHTGGWHRRSDDLREFIELTSYKGREKGLVTLGDHCRIAFGAVILGYGGVRIGEKCGVGPGAVILSESFHHKGKDESRIYKYSQGALPEEQCVIQGFVEFKDGAGVASHVIVLPGATLGRDAWVAPKSVVRMRGKIEDNTIAKGDPAVTIFRRRYPKE